MQVTDDLVHMSILGWAADPGTPAQRVEYALQGWRKRFGAEPQVILYAPSKGTAIRGDTDDPLLVARQSHIEFREYEVVGKEEYRVAVKLNDEPHAALPEFYQQAEVVEVKKRSAKQEARHQEAVSSGLLEVVALSATTSAERKLLAFEEIVEDYPLPEDTTLPDTVVPTVKRRVSSFARIMKMV